MRLAIVVLTAILCTACKHKKSDAADSEAFRAGRVVAELKNSQLKEVSGLAASLANRGLLWAPNDSGNPAVVYLLDRNLNVRLACKLSGVKNRDWEDIAVGPGPTPGKTYVYVADIGDNNARHQTKYIYRFEEPVAGDQENITITAFDTIAFRLDGEMKDTEALIVHPETNDIYIFSKREKPVHVYRLKYPFKDKVSVATSIATLPLTHIVAADISADGEEILLKNYDNIYYWHLKGRSLTDAFKEKPTVLTYTPEPQGEAIAFSADGAGFFTLSETIRGRKTYLYYYKRNAR